MRISFKVGGRVYITEIPVLYAKLKNGTLARITDTRIRTLGNDKRKRKYDWNDLEVMNDVIATITGARQRK